MSDPFRVGGYRFDRGRLGLAVVAATVPSAIWILTDILAGHQPNVPIIVLGWLYLLGLLVALSVKGDTGNRNE